MEGELVKLEWRLYAGEEGGSATFWRRTPGGDIRQSGPELFDTLDELPEPVAQIIREDGRSEGEWPEDDE